MNFIDCDKMLEIPDIFPPAASADRDGCLCYSREINPTMILSAYLHGIFPWPQDNKYILWFSPPRRCLFDFQDIHVPRSTEREFRKNGFTLSVNRHFEQVIRHCAEVPRADHGTWITPKLIAAYTEMHRLGFAFSFETLDAEGKLVGGMYGIKLGTYFAGESMFRLRDGGSKFALLKGMEYLSATGSSWLDAQVMNPFLKRLGAKVISRDRFLKKLNNELEDHFYGKSNPDSNGEIQYSNI